MNLTTVYRTSMNIAIKNVNLFINLHIGIFFNNF